MLKQEIARVRDERKVTYASAATPAPPLLAMLDENARRAHPHGNRDTAVGSARAWSATFPKTLSMTTD